MPDRGGDAHHPRRPFEAVLCLGAYIGMPPVTFGVRPLRSIYQSDIILIDESSSAAAARGRPGGGRADTPQGPVRLTINEGNNVLVLVSSGQDQAAAAGAQMFLSRIQAVTSPGPVVAVRRRAGSGPAGGGWPPAGPHRPGAAG